MIKKNIAPVFWGTLSLCFGYYLLGDFWESQTFAHPGKVRLSREKWNDGSPLDGLTLRDSLLFSAQESDSLAPLSPFRQSQPTQAAKAKTASQPAFVRPTIVLKGTVGDQAATLADPMGRKAIVRVGDSWDSSKVIEIMPGKVRLRDRHGIYEITSPD